MKKTMITAAAALLMLTGCTVGDQEPPTGDPQQTLSPDGSEQSEEGGTTDAVSGRPLSDFEGSATYDWRKAIAEDPEVILEQMQQVVPELEQEDLSALLDTCAAIDGGADDETLVQESVKRFAPAPGERVTPDQATSLIGIARESVCP